MINNNFTLTQIDPYNCTIEYLEKEITKLKGIVDNKFDEEQSIKRWIVSIYGGLGSPWFSHYDAAIAEAITLQGQDIDKYASRMIDDYFKNEWHLDKELHQKLCLTYVNKANFETLTVYMDTDSFYITYNQILESCDYKGNPVDFMLELKKYRLDDYLDEKLQLYANKFNTQNIQNFELEKISHSAIMIAKKKYILDLGWKDPGIYYKSQEKIKHVGIEVVQGSTPQFARKVIKEMISYTLEKKKNLNYGEVVKKLKEYKKEFLLQNPDDIAITKSLGDYEQYILEDKKELKLALKCPINIRAAGIYNHMLLNSKWKTKYSLAKTGDKLKYYHAKGQYDLFGFLPNNFPIEFGLQIDYDTQYFKVIIEPYNRILEALGLNRIPETMIYAKSLF